MLGRQRFFFREIDSFPKIFILGHSVRQCRVPNQTEEKIVIPPRIERGPTDILKALASTVGVDHTAFHYKYPDDPYFYPFSESKKEILALAMESGRKSAKWIFENNPGFFQKQLSDPPIMDYLVKPVLSAESEPTEETLLIAIEGRNVLKAIEIYKLLESKNIDVSKSTSQSLLELTCFFNCNEKPHPELEEKWFGKDISNLPELKFWEHQGFAQKLFEKMDSSCPLANSAIIQGMLKYNKVMLAQQYFEAAKMKKVKFSVGVYNSLLRKIPGRITVNKVIPFIKEMLNEMSRENVKPDVKTLNALLLSLAECSDLRGKTKFTLSIMSEFQRLNIEPSLGSYGYLFRILTSSQARSNLLLLHDIMNYIKHKKFELIDPCDLQFFSISSIAFADHIDTSDLSLELLDMFFRNDNSRFLRDFTTEIDFFRNVFFVVFKSKPIELAMDVYRRYAWTSYSPNFKIIRGIISAIKKNSEPEYLVKLWEDHKNFNLLSSRSCLIEILNLIKYFSDVSSLKVFHSAAILYVNGLKSDDYFSEKEDALSNVIIAFVKNDDEENISMLFNNLKEKKIESKLNEYGVRALFNYALSKQKVQLLLDTLKIAVHEELPSASEMASKALPLLDDQSKAWLTGLVGNDQKSQEKS